MWRFALALPVFLMSIEYEVNFVGLRDEAVLKSLFDVSDLVLLQDRPPASLNGLIYRASSDVGGFIKVLHAYGYYDATVKPDVEMKGDVAQVYVYVKPGPQYRMGSYEVFKGDCKEPGLVACCEPFTMERLGLREGQPALSVDIVNAELQLLDELAKCGYPLASVEKRRVEVDMAEKEVHAAACIAEGPIAKFGPLSIFGLKGVKPEYVFDRVTWEEGELYNPDVVAATQKKLLNSDLFSSVLISHDEEVDAQGELAMKMRVSEAKHRQLSVGAFYATVDGPGVSFAWTHRNVRGLGEIVSLNGEYSKRYWTGKVTYKKPDFLKLDQTYRALAEVAREHIYAYTAFSYRFANYLDQRDSPRRSWSVGLEAAHTNVTESASNGSYLLMGLPLFVRYNTTDDILNATKGYTLVYQATPFQSLFHANQHFVKQRFTATWYWPVARKKLILACRAQAGSIAGAKQKNVPLPILFLGGSEDDLRGYRYMTVSPLNEHHKPYGGRSALFFTSELRFRLTETIGLVSFADFGTVTFDLLPQVETKWYKSVGGGLRYFTFFGPLRFDVGFPLDRRRHVDHKYQIYASIGQTF